MPEFFLKDLYLYKILNMKSKDKKQRLFEVMQRVDKTFIPNINESSNDLCEHGDQSNIQDAKTGRQLSIGDVVKVEGLSGEYQIGMKTSEGEPFLMAFSLNSKRANPYHRIYLTALNNPKFEIVLSYSDTDGGFVSENKRNESNKTFTINIWGEDEEVYFDLKQYQNNNALAVQLMSVEEGPYAMISTNIQPDSSELPADEFFLKDWSENEPLAKELIKLGALIPTGKEASSGFVKAKSYKVNPNFKLNESTEDTDNEPFKNLKYEEETKTIRTVPENYWIATVKDKGNIAFNSWDGAIKDRIDKEYVKNWFKENVGNVNEGINMNEEETRPLHDIAQEIYREWRPVHPHAKPYVDAMSTLTSIDDNYMMDSGRSIVAYFLSNASQWKDETARRIKAELKKMLGLREGQNTDTNFNEDFSSLRDLPLVPSEEDVHNLIPKAIRDGYITKEEFEANKDNFITAASETAENWSDMEEIGSSYMTSMMKEFLRKVGKCR